MKEFQVIGKKAEGEELPLYKMVVFAKNHLIAKTRFFKAMRLLNKIKRADAEIVSLEELKEDSVLKARSYGVWIRVNSKNNPKNIYKEYRETSRVKAAEKCFLSLRVLYKLDYYQAEIISMVELEEDSLKREEVRQYAREGIRFPNILPAGRPARNRFVLSEQK